MKLFAISDLHVGYAENRWAIERVTPRPEHYGDTARDPITELVSSFNNNVDRLNARIFTYQDFAAIATKS